MAEALAVAKPIILASRDRVTHGGRLRNVGKKGAAINVTTKVSGSGVGGTIGSIKATGPWPIIENDIGPHLIGAGKATKVVKRGFSGPSRPGNKRQVLKFGGGYAIGSRFVTGPVKHPGTKGKHPFILGRQAAVGPVVAVLQKSNTRVVRSMF